MSFINWQVKTFSYLPSTQDVIRELAAEGEPEGIVVQCLVQTAGRGRQSNAWESPMGNLYMSMLLRPQCNAMVAGQISFIAGVALSAAIDEVIAPGHVKTLKWPNDVLIDGRKCAGILLESVLGAGGAVESLALGMGVNIMAPPTDRIGLQQVAAGQVAIHLFRDKVLSHFAAFYKHWKADGFGAIRDEFMRQAHGLDQPITARLPAGEQSGIFRGIDDSGALQLERPDGKRLAVQAGEVYFPSP